MTSGAQPAARVDEPIAAEIDRLVAAGRFPSRAEAVRAAVHSHLEPDRRRRVAVVIGEGYERVPDTEDELATAERNLRRLIAEEPW